MQRHGSKDSDDRVREMEERLRQEEYLKQGYEKTVRELRDRVRELESQGRGREDYRREIDELRAELAKEREWRTNFSSLEADLNHRISSQSAQISLLESQLRDKSSELHQISFKDQEFSRLTQENAKLASELRELQSKYDKITEECRELSDKEYLSTLHKELTLKRRENEPETAEMISELERKMKELEGKYAFQMEYSRNLQSQLQDVYEKSPSSKRIEELEAKLRTSSAKYEEMKRQITAPASFHRQKEGSEAGKGGNRPPRPKVQEEMQSFRSYSIKEEGEGRKKNKRTKSVDKRSARKKGEHC